MITAFIVLGVLILTIIFMYNSLVYKKNQVENVFSTVDVLLNKRYDLIPNLVETVKGYAAHEKEVLERISELRAEALSSKTKDEKIGLDERFENNIDSVFAISENYPELKASKSFLKLQAALCEVEEQISAARRAYNASVTDLNNAIEMFPSNILAGIMGYQKEKLFQINPQASANRVWYNN